MGLKTNDATIFVLLTSFEGAAADILRWKGTGRSGASERNRRCVGLHFEATSRCKKSSSSRRWLLQREDDDRQDSSKLQTDHSPPRTQHNTHGSGRKCTRCAGVLHHHTRGRIRTNTRHEIKEKKRERLRFFLRRARLGYTNAGPQHE